jgi:hypothetical protein
MRAIASAVTCRPSVGYPHRTDGIVVANPTGDRGLSSPGNATHHIASEGVVVGTGGIGRDHCAPPAPNWAPVAWVGRSLRANLRASGSVASSGRNTL